jgi:hypothetical protein
LCAHGHFTIYDNHLFLPRADDEATRPNRASTVERSVNAQLVVCCWRCPCTHGQHTLRKPTTRVPRACGASVRSLGLVLMDGYRRFTTGRATSIVSIARLTTAGSTMNQILHRFSIEADRNFALVDDVRFLFLHTSRNSYPNPPNLRATSSMQPILAIATVGRRSTQARPRAHDGGLATGRLTRHRDPRATVSHSDHVVNQSASATCEGA